MTELHWPWLQGPTDLPDPAVDGRSASATAAETRQTNEWGHMYWQPKPAEPEEAA